ncbi:unnamed protein product [Calicophoron daubneyi]|uniref:HD domain-containing protein n=1 Tax=Calicophoron daubneyi TaxID=300641 RepID=A0AAV2U1Q7_CALDB
MEHPKIIQDAVHGMIELDPIALLIVDTPEFQRLRQIRQMGLSYFVFPSCQHTRFEHSIGTYHMAARLVGEIQNDSSYVGPKMSESEQLAVKIAALCHDLGHGPFSHTWENHMERGGSRYYGYKHEKMSCLVLERIVRNKKILQKRLAEAGVDLELIKSLIMGKPLEDEKVTHLLRLVSPNRPYIYEILSNAANGTDVDKWDYLLRDCLHAGMGHGNASIDLDRLMHFYRPAPHTSGDEGDSGFLDPEKPRSGKGECKWHLSFRDTELENVLRTFSLRQHLHKKLYQHKTVNSISQMVLDILDMIEPIMKLREISLNALQTGELDAFLELDDSLLWDIYRKRLPCLKTGQPNARLDLAHQIFYRILTRNLYVYIDTVFEVHDSEPDISPSQASAALARNTKHRRSVASCLETHEPFSNETLPPDGKIVGRLSSSEVEDTASLILNGVYSHLPPGSGITDRSELLVTKSIFRSNSTTLAPHFYCYTRLGKTFIYREPLRTVYAYRLYWRGNEIYQCEDGEKQKESHMSGCVALLKAFDTWHHDVMCDRELT